MIKTGWGRREISLDEKMSLPGQAYMRVSEGVHDPLYATAWCVDDGKDAAIFCTCDLIHIRGDILSHVLDQVAQIRPELPVDAVILGATHTEEPGGPQSMGSLRVGQDSATSLSLFTFMH